MQGEEGVFTDSVFLQATCGAEIQVDWMLGVSFQVGLTLQQGQGRKAGGSVGRWCVGLALDLRQSAMQEGWDRLVPPWSSGHRVEGGGSQCFGPSLTAFPGHRQGAGWEAGLLGFELMSKKCPSAF